MCFDARLLPKPIPADRKFSLAQLGLEYFCGWRGRLGREIIVVQDDLCVSDAGQQTADSKSVAPNHGPPLAHNRPEFKSVRLTERLSEEPVRNAQPGMAQVRGRRQVTLARFVDVECKLCPDVRVMILGIAGARAEFLVELWESTATAGLIASECPIVSPM
jgi:hypothetical protein